MDPRHSYRQAAGQGASGVRLVILLYEQIIQDLGRAIQAMEQSDIERRTREVNHALTVINHLQCTLDLERGGKVARNLAHFYTTVRTSLVEAHARASRKLLEQQIAYLLEMREAWAEVDRAITASASPQTAATPGNWRG